MGLVGAGIMMCASLKVLSTGKDGDNLKRSCHPNAQNKEINLHRKLITLNNHLNNFKVQHEDK
ncbi:hypothetical protein DPMN_095416 [Dreissena polymorpha]|uniref:Uncharacterized protein n=1 Tax=Dreissena polymorpha TaxID=45954 RepID=A0A9D4L7I8_DREPO|nr:hypothetical protein DPMN_095416 [Dreissena polymorpha]